MGYMFDVMRFLCQDLDAQKKLSNLGIESMNDMRMIMMYAKNLGQTNSDINSNLSAVLNDHLQNSVERLADIYFAVLFPNERSGMGLPDLRPYDTFLDAVKSISKEKGVDLLYFLEDRENIDVENRYPLTIRKKHGNKLTIHLSIEKEYFIINYTYNESGGKIVSNEVKGFLSIYDAVYGIDDLVKQFS